MSISSGVKKDHYFKLTRILRKKDVDFKVINNKSKDTGENIELAVGAKEDVSSESSV